MKRFISFLQRCVGWPIKDSCHKDCLKSKSTESSEDLKPASQPLIEKGNSTILYCPFCGTAYLWDSSTITTDSVTFATDKVCTSPNCEGVNLLYLCFIPGSLSLRQTPSSSKPLAD